VNALDYLLKPVDCERLSKAVERAKSRLTRSNRDDQLDSRFRALLEDIKTGSKFLKRLTIKLTGRPILLPTDEIDWIETQGNYLKVHAGRESHLIRGTMQSLETKLDPEKFVRVHRSAIVNVEKIKEIYPRSNGDQDLVLQNGRQLMLSRNYRDNSSPRWEIRSSLGHTPTVKGSDPTQRFGHLAWIRSVPPAVAGGCVALEIVARLRTHPLPQGVLTVSNNDPQQ